ncbi:MAG: hypothetical protein KDC53_07470 [Saprospiraceae bacterium]|nr:hypothetical protein [Saprospiraceae bacterium]
MKIKLFCFAALLTALTTTITAQNSQKYFGDHCVGNWKGTMLMYNDGILSDSVAVLFEVSKIENEDNWIWRTTYQTAAKEIIKDYILKLEDAEKGQYIIDEKDGILLNCFQVENKLFSIFSVGENLLTAIYQITDEQIIFEVTSGKKEQATGDGTISNYSINHLQKVVLKKI